jgi:hypothetical protein
MEFKLVRTFEGDYETLGYLMVDGKEFCKTLEDAVRDVKIKDRTCIPYGEYSIKLSYSPKFKKLMPLIYNTKDDDVKNEHGDHWGGVRIHGGNTNLNSEGCLLVAKSQFKNQKLVGKVNFDGTPIMNYIQGSMADDVKALFKENEVYKFIIEKEQPNA